MRLDTFADTITSKSSIQTDRCLSSIKNLQKYENQKVNQDGRVTNNNSDSDEDEKWAENNGPSKRLKFSMDQEFNEMHENKLKNIGEMISNSKELSRVFLNLGEIYGSDNKLET